MTPNQGLEAAISYMGSMQKLADLLGVTKGAVGQWKQDERQIPIDHCPTIEKKTGVRCEVLRPDFDWAYLRASDATAPKRTKQAAPP